MEIEEGSDPHEGPHSCRENDTFARLDVVEYKEDHTVILCVDEFQHSDYEIDCEVSCMSKVITATRASGDERPGPVASTQPRFLQC